MCVYESMESSTEARTDMLVLSLGPFNQKCTNITLQWVHKTQNQIVLLSKHGASTASMSSVRNHDTLARGAWVLVSLRSDKAW